MSTLPYSARTRFDRSPHMCVFSSTFPSGIGKTLSFSTRFVYKYALLHFRQTTRRTTPPHPIDTIHPRSIDRSPIELSSSWSPSAKQFTRQIHSSERFVCHPQLQLARCHLSSSFDWLPGIPIDCCFCFTVAKWASTNQHARHACVCRLPQEKFSLSSGKKRRGRFYYRRLDEWWVANS